MKHLFIVALLTLEIGVGACDNCNIFLGINPKDFNHSVQFLYRWNWKFGTFNDQGVQLMKHGSSDTYTNSEVVEYYATYSLRAKLFLKPKLNVLIDLPYRNNYRAISNRTVADVYGVGDPVALLNYRLINSKKSDSSRITHRLSLSMGVKSPLGSYRLMLNEELLSHDMQPGSGTFDPLFGVNYYLKSNFWGINTSVNYKANTKNKMGFEYGDRINIGMGVFSILTIKKAKFLPFIGSYSEFRIYDKIKNRIVKNSEFYAHYMRISTTVFLNNWSINGECLLPIAQQIHGTNLINGNRIRFGLSYYFNN
ncbi:hypothetical protein N9M27_03005 [Flavobacteriales bacterium]|nr:hypothetical protein [Flavobacteriales bacterium]